MSFIVYDLALLVLFIVFISIFLHKKRSNLKLDGILYLYRTQLGMKLIEYVGKKYKRILHASSYVSISLAYVLMASMMYLIIQSVYLYLTTPIAKVIKAPPIAPLIPYFPKLFGLESFFPAFYFVYFIIAIVIVATVHEFAHGVFARRYGIKIKSTGFAFFKYMPAFLGAFVEQDEKSMKKATNFQQRSVLAAGVFANVITAILFYVLLFGFFSLAFAPAGVTFNTYSYSVIDSSEIVMINGVPVQNPSMEEIRELTNSSSLNDIETKNKKFVGIRGSDQQGNIAVYDDAPAINADLIGAITKINGIEVTSIAQLGIELSKYNPGVEITVTTLNEDGEINDKRIVLEENPRNPGSSWLGIGFLDQTREGIIGKILNSVPKYQEQHIYYEEKSFSSVFIKDLLWWIVIINLLVALFNMLPIGILDGGLFFYLTALRVTKSKKIADKIFKWLTYFIIFLFVLLMVAWLWSFIS